jgi:CO/xanthine dehydrogenase FAD-binding subunit
MIIEYFRPQSLEETLLLLSRPYPVTVPLGGGVKLSRRIDEQIAVVDLQRLGLNTVEITENSLKIGATVTLQQLYENGNTPQALKDAIRHETNYNLRQMATIAGTMVCANGLSPMACVFLALGAKLQVEPGGDLIDLGVLLNCDREHFKKLITHLLIKMDQRVSFTAIGRSLFDKPRLCVAVCEINNGSRRIVVSNNGTAPRLLEESEIKNMIKCAHSHLFSSKNDYLAEISLTLITRLTQFKL